MRNTIVRCDVIDCEYRDSDGYCGNAVIDMEFHKQDNLHEYAICKDYERKEVEE